MKKEQNRYDSFILWIVTSFLLVIIEFPVFSQTVRQPLSTYPARINQNDGTGNNPSSVILKQNSPVAVSNTNWFDATRYRSIPVKIYWPVQFPGKCPVIIFSHGLGGSNEKCAYLGQVWAAQGFVSVHVQHLGLDEQVWKGKIRPIKELKDIYGQHWSGRTQANDVRFVLDRLDSLAESGTSIGHLIDMTRVGVAGYDLGGLAAMLVAGQMPPDRGSSLHDPRVKAIVVMSPPVADQMTFASASYGAMSVPALFFTGTEDDGVIGSTKSWQRRIPFDQMTGNDRFLITYQGAGHLIYSGHVLPTRSRDDQKYQANVTQVSTLFWRAYLREEPAVYTYFQSQSLGGIVGTLGRVERRLGGTTNENNNVHSHQGTYLKTAVGNAERSRSGRTE